MWLPGSLSFPVLKVQINKAIMICKSKKLFKATFQKTTSPTHKETKKKGACFLIGFNKCKTKFLTIHIFKPCNNQYCRSEWQLRWTDFKVPTCRHPQKLGFNKEDIFNHFSPLKILAQTSLKCQCNRGYPLISAWEKTSSVSCAGRDSISLLLEHTFISFHP